MYTNEQQMRRLKLRELRAKLRITQDHLARDIGVSRSSVNQWETGRWPIPEANYQKLVAYIASKKLNLVDYEGESVKPVKNDENLQLVISTLQDALLESRENYKRLEKRFDCLESLIAKLDQVILMCDKAISIREKPPVNPPIVKKYSQVKPKHKHSELVNA